MKASYRKKRKDCVEKLIKTITMCNKVLGPIPVHFRARLAKCFDEDAHILSIGMFELILIQSVVYGSYAPLVRTRLK